MYVPLIPIVQVLCMGLYQSITTPISEMYWHVRNAIVPLFSH